MSDLERLQRLVLDNGATDFDAVCTLIRAQLHHNDLPGARRTLSAWITANPASIPTMSLQPGVQWVAQTTNKRGQQAQGIVHPTDLFKTINRGDSWQARFADEDGGGGSVLVPLLWDGPAQIKFICAVIELTCATVLRNAGYLPRAYTSTLSGIARLQRESADELRSQAIKKAAKELADAIGHVPFMPANNQSWRHNSTIHLMMDRQERDLADIMQHHTEFFLNDTWPLDPGWAINRLLDAESDTTAFQLKPKQLVYDLLIKTWLGEEPVNPTTRWTL